MQSQKHQPVLLREVFEVLNLHAGETYLDFTAGYGGHATVASKAIGEPSKLILVDRDPAAIKILRTKFAGANLIHKDFATAAKELVSAGFQADAILIDLGVSSPQLDEAARGFSFKADGPLDMRMDSSTGKTAAELVNHLSEKQLADTIYRYGEERRSRQIAKAIVDSRPLTTTTQLAAVIARASARSGKIHPATRTFQALRIAVNDELGQLETVLPLAIKLLLRGGRLAVISFHSLEDRIVKQFLKEQTRQGVVTLVNKKVITASSHELTNRRARSAKLRAAIKN